MSARSKHEALSRELILDTALTLAQQDGVEALSMRRIAAALDTGAMSLYNHVPDKEALLQGLAERVFAEVVVPPEAGWRETTIAWARSVRSTILANGPLVPVLVGPRRGFPLVTLARSAVAALENAGLEPSAARRVTDVVSRFVAGSVMIDAAFLRGRIVARKKLDRTFDEGLQALVDGLQSRLKL